jgi:hypothetical protein
VVPRQQSQKYRRYARFLDFGEAADYQQHVERMRAALAEEKG